jgi:hypothetical protein
MVYVGYFIRHLQRNPTTTLRIVNVLAGAVPIVNSMENVKTCGEEHERAPAQRDRCAEAR